MTEVGLQRRFRHAACPATIGQVQTPLHGGHRADDIGEAMLAQFGGFDGCDDRGPARPACQCIPCLDGFVDPAQSAEQVRSIVGSLKHVGEGKWPVEEMAAALAAKDRSRCGALAPSSGLYLVRVDYPPGPFPPRDRAASS